MSAGVRREDDDFSDDNIEEVDENSPGVVRKAAAFEDESF